MLTGMGPEQARQVVGTRNIERQAGRMEPYAPGANSPDFPRARPAGGPVGSASVARQLTGLTGEQLAQGIEQAIESGASADDPAIRKAQLRLDGYRREQRTQDIEDQFSELVRGDTEQSEQLIRRLAQDAKGMLDRGEIDRMPARLAAAIKRLAAGGSVSGKGVSQTRMRELGDAAADMVLGREKWVETPSPIPGGMPTRSRQRSGGALWATSWEAAGVGGGDRDGGRHYEDALRDVIGGKPTEGWKGLRAAYDDWKAYWKGQPGDQGRMTEDELAAAFEQFVYRPGEQHDMLQRAWRRMTKRPAPNRKALPREQAERYANMARQANPNASPDDLRDIARQMANEAGYTW
jgi:hypothetical protein